MSMLSSLTGGLFDKTKLMESGQSKAAKAELIKRGKEDVQVPKRTVLGLDPLEEIAKRLATDYAKSPTSPVFGQAQGLMQKFATGGEDFLSSPGFQALKSTVMKEGEVLGRRLTRGLTLKGNTPGTASKGRDVLGRQVGDVENRLMTAALPYMESAKQREFAAIPIMTQIEQMEAQSRLSKLDVGENVGQKLRLLDQAIKDTEYNQIMEQLSFRYQIQPQILGGATSSPQAINTPGLLSQASQALGFAKSAGEFGKTTATAMGF